MDEHHVSHGTLKLYVDDEVIGQHDDFRTMTGHFSLCGEGLCIGYDSGRPSPCGVRRQPVPASPTAS